MRNTPRRSAIVARRRAGFDGEKTAHVVGQQPMRLDRLVGDRVEHGGAVVEPEVVQDANLEQARDPIRTTSTAISAHCLLVSELADDFGDQPALALGRLELHLEHPHRVQGERELLPAEHPPHVIDFFEGGGPQVEDQLELDQPVEVIDRGPVGERLRVDVLLGEHVSGLEEQE